MPKVVIVRRTGVRTPPGAIYVGRPSKWGNPFRLLSHVERLVVIDKYEAWVNERIASGELNIEELRGKHLACWCHEWDGQGANPRYCHADILLELANRPADRAYGPTERG